MLNDWKTPDLFFLCIGALVNLFKYIFFEEIVATILLNVEGVLKVM